MVCFHSVNSASYNPLCAAQVCVNLGFFDLIWTHSNVYKLRNTFTLVSIICILISINLLLGPGFFPLSCEASPHLYAILIHPALIDLTNLLSEPANTAARVHQCLSQPMLHSQQPRTPGLLLFYNCPLTSRPWKTQLALQQSREVFPADSGEPICLVGMEWQAAGSGLSVMQCLYRAWAVSAISLNCHPHANDRRSKRQGVWWCGGGGIFLMSTFLNCTRSGTKKVSNFTKHDFHSGAEGYHPPMTAKPSWLQQTPVPYLPPPPPPLPPPPPPLSNEPSRFEGKLKSRRADASGRLDRTA